jgi:glycosidase
MTFVSNHDKNAWDGTQFEAFAQALENAIVLSFVSEGMPLIYNGQEAGNPRRLPFFDRDPIEWREHPIGDLYRRLIALKKSNSALWNGHWGADMIQVVNDSPGQVFSFVRADERNTVFAVFNFSDAPREVHFAPGPWPGTYRDFTTGNPETLGVDSTLALPAWSYRVLTR